jgi:hypothetical protein
VSIKTQHYKSVFVRGNELVVEQQIPHLLHQFSSTMCDDRRLLTSRWYDILYMIRKLNKGESGDYNGRKQGNTD